MLDGQQGAFGLEGASGSNAVGLCAVAAAELPNCGELVLGALASSVPIGSRAQDFAHLVHTSDLEQVGERPTTDRLELGRVARCSGVSALCLIVK